MKTLVPLLFIMTELMGSARAQTPHDDHAGSPPSSVAFENRAVRVLRIVLPPHTKVPMHDVTPRLVIWMTNGHLKMTFPDGRTVEQTHHVGDTEWLDAQRHAGENTGDERIEIMAITFKERLGDWGP